MDVVFAQLPCRDAATCTGCAACAAICHNDSITMEPNSEGFLYPQIDSNLCNECGLCFGICPVNQKNSPETPGNGVNGKKPSAVFAAWHLNESIRRGSSSGGIFSALAETVLRKGGAVVGAAFDDEFVVRHIHIENLADLEKLRGSKYVQTVFAPPLHKFIRAFLK